MATLWRRAGLWGVLVLPPGLLGFWALFPQANQAFADALFHFYIVSFTTFAATVVSVFVTSSVGTAAQPRHLALAVACAWMGAVFFIHGVTTPGAVLAGPHPAIAWSAWFTFLGGGVLFLVSAYAPAAPDPRFLRAVAGSTALAYAAYVAAVLLAPGLLQQGLQLRRPPLSTVVFWITLLVWLVSAGQHYRRFRRTGHSFDGLMALESLWFATGTISMFQFALWSAAWWLYHVVLLGGFLCAIAYLWRAYEQIRAFRLNRYFAATSLIFTAALALLSAHLYSQLTGASLQQQLKNQTAAVSQELAQTVMAALPAVQTAADLRALTPDADWQAWLAAQAGPRQLDQISMYDLDGRPVASAAHAAAAGPAGMDMDTAEADLAGGPLTATQTRVTEPDHPPADYQPAQPVYVVEARTPLYPAGDPAGAALGTLVVVREAPELGQSLILARQSGIALAGLSLGGLLLALFIIIRRADQIITSRTRELEAAYGELRRVEGLRDDLANMIVHDLRNPLTAVLANLDLLTRTLAPLALTNEAPPRYLGRARQAGQRMLGLIDELLNVSKLESGELHSTLRALPLAKWLSEKEQAYRAQAEKDDKHLDFQVCADGPTLLADAELLGRVLDNLVGNAFKYTERGGHVRIAADWDDQALRVRVSDDGPGIPSEFHQRIFDKFFQVAGPHGAPLRQGTGLGLAFCRLAVEAHGGRIWVESTPGAGSTFTFTVPLQSALARAAG